MARISMKSADKDMVLSEFIVATKKQRPYFEAWIKASKRTGESIEDFLRRTIIVAALRFIAENESSNIKSKGQLSLDELQKEVNEVELRIFD